MLRCFFNKDFFLLWLGRSISQMGDGAGFIAVMWWIQAELGSPVALGTLAMAKGLTATILSPFAGVLADRLDRKKIIVWGDVVRGLINIYLGYMAVSGTLTLVPLIILSCVAVACGQFTRVVQNNRWSVKWGVIIQSGMLFSILLLPAQMWYMHMGVMYFVGLFNAIVNIYFQSIMQRITRKQYMGKVFALLNMATGALIPASQGLSGALAGIFSLRSIFAVSFSACCASGTLFARIGALMHSSTDILLQMRHAPTCNHKIKRQFPIEKSGTQSGDH